MDQIEKEKFEKILGKGNIERKVKRQVIKGKDGREIPIVDMQKVTGLDERGGIVDGEIDNIHEYGCGCVAEGRQNYGGQCSLCGATFCNKVANNKPTCYKRCKKCRRMVCMKHVIAPNGSDTFCSWKCYLFANPTVAVVLSVVAIIAIFIIIKVMFH